MISIKIQCGCGQPYAFDVEPVEGQMPSAIACPTCGADGTAAANEAIAQSAPAAPPPAVRLHSSAPPPPAPLHAAPAPAETPGYRRPLLPGQVTREQAAVEAKAKISWGDSPESVTAYLRMQGYEREEAKEMVDELYRERVALVRGTGIKKIVVGSILVCVPIATLIGFLAIGVIYTNLLALTVMVGLWGLWTVFKGITMIIAPKMEHGDVAEQ